MNEKQTMPQAHTTVRPVTAADCAAWREMWDAYCRFYDTVLSETVIAATWSRILDARSPIAAAIAVDAPSGTAAGFVNYVVHPHTWSELPACYLEDLFVCPESRGRGIGRALIEHVLALGRRHGWSRVYWMTHERNAGARRLYDRFAARDDFVRYVVPLDEVPAGDET